MPDFEGTSAEMPEVAEPVENETGAEDPEVAEPESTEHQKTEADATFAEMRRQMQEAQKAAEDARAELAQMQAENEARSSIYSRLTGKGDDAEIAALSEVTGMSEDEIRAEMDAAREAAQKDMRIQQLEEQLDDVEAERMMQAHLSELRKIDPKLRSLDELGEPYFNYIAMGATPEDAYWAVKGREIASQKTPPKPPGTVATGTAEKDRYTDAEIDAMSSEQLRANWKKVFSSWGK